MIWTEIFDGLLNLYTQSMLKNLKIYNYIFEGKNINKFS